MAILNANARMQEEKASYTNGKNRLKAEPGGKDMEFIQQRELFESVWNVADAGIFQ